MIGGTVGSYRIDAKLGEGGMGVVYTATHTLIGREAVIKVLHRELTSNEQIVQRFFNEARAATAVKHPGIVEIYDFGYDTDSSAYIVMERLEGESLSERIRGLERIPDAQVVSLMRHVVTALGAAHGGGIVHRDLKPDNIFVVPDSGAFGGERTKILDFGIAKLMANRSAAYRTRTGSVMGTPNYMAPEQCKGAGKVDHRTDIYALGCIMFHMLCGRVPFVAEGPGEVMAQHIYAPPPPLRPLEPAVPPKLEELVLRLLAKEPDARYQTAEEVGAALEQLAGGVPTAVRAHTSGARPVVPRAPSATPIPGAALAGTPIPGAARLATPAPVGGAALAGARADSAPPQQTTLSAAAAAAASVTGPSPPTTGPRRRLRIAIRLVAAMAVGGGVIAAVAGGGGAGGEEAAEAAKAESASTPAPEKPASQLPAVEPSVTPLPAQPEPAAGTVAVSITSKPPGAEVYAQPSGKRLGETPWSDDLEGKTDERVFLVKKKGYEPATVTLAGNRDATEEVELRRARTRKRPATVTKKRLRPKDDKRKKELESGGSLNPFED